MNNITNFSDVIYIIDNKIDIKDEKGYNIPFVRFVGFSLIQVTRLINTGKYTYNTKN